MRCVLDVICQVILPIVLFCWGNPLLMLCSLYLSKANSRIGPY